MRTSLLEVILINRGRLSITSISLTVRNYVFRRRCLCFPTAYSPQSSHRFRRPRRRPRSPALLKVPNCVAPAKAIKICDILSINPPRKLMEEYWFLAPRLRRAISSALLNIFFWNSPRQPSRCTGQATTELDLDRSMKKTASCKKATELPG